MEEIKKPWAIYGDQICFYDFGKIIKEREFSVDIKHTDNQTYPPQCWDSKYIKRFGNPSDAIIFLLKNQGIPHIHERDDLIKRIKSNFPEIIIQEKYIQQVTNATMN